MKVKAYCRTCGHFVSDDLEELEKGFRNVHEHPVRLMRLMGQGELQRGAVAPATDLTPIAYFDDVSKLDAELTVSYMKRMLKEQGVTLPIPDQVLSGLVSWMLKALRQMAVEDEQKHRQAKIKSKVKEPKQERVEEPLA